MVRYLVERYRQPTAKEIREYRDRMCCGLNEAKRTLARPDKTTLQFWAGGVWNDVPVVVKMTLGTVPIVVDESSQVPEK